MIIRIKRNGEPQLLQGESLILTEGGRIWLKVGAIEQLRYTDQEGWGPYQAGSIARKYGGSQHSTHTSFALRVLFPMGLGSILGRRSEAARYLLL